jgi:hypothetical protein
MSSRARGATSYPGLGPAPGQAQGPGGGQKKRRRRGRGGGGGAKGPATQKWVGLPRDEEEVS